ncbi:hypothetical protein B5E92_11470 [Erysipelatoclostridium sp. An15]|jgi:hypothetical protein|nr:hypothetical protein B5E92_11470 [Erysipelatoclostridium sp. An15]
MKMKLIYTRNGDYLFPNLTIKNQSTNGINKYGYLRLRYLKENKKALYTTLLMTNELTNHLISVSKNSEDRLQILMENYKNSDKKLSEKNKEINHIKWSKLMNNYKNKAEEIILNDLVFI